MIQGNDTVVTVDFTEIMIEDLKREREMLMWFMQQRRCWPIKTLLLDALNDVIACLVHPDLQKYPDICRKLAVVTDTAWCHVFGYYENTALNRAWSRVSAQLETMAPEDQTLVLYALVLGKGQP